jgi:glycerol uptake facilitator protein
MTSTARDVVGEALGTFVLVAVGTSSVALAVIVDALTAAWQVAAVWGVGVATAIVVASRFSRAHLNPAVTLAVACVRPDACPRDAVPRHWLGQMIGAVLGGLVVWAVFGARIAVFESAHGLVRGAPGDERAAMVFGEYFPNPTSIDAAPVSPAAAFAAELAGTAAMMIAALAAFDAAAVRRWPTFVPAAIVGATVAAVILVVGPITQAGLNPARDFGPRLVAWLAGFGDVAIPGPRGGFWVYVAGPFAGALVGAAAYETTRRAATRRAGA